MGGGEAVVSSNCSKFDFGKGTVSDDVLSKSNEQDTCFGST